MKVVSMFNAVKMKTSISNKITIRYDTVDIIMVVTTYAINASHSKKLSSLTGPATIPSGGSKVNSKRIPKIYMNPSGGCPLVGADRLIHFFFTKDLRLYSAISLRSAEPAMFTFCGCPDYEVMDGPTTTTNCFAKFLFCRCSAAFFCAALLQRTAD